MILVILAWLSVAAWVYRDAQRCRADGDNFPAIRLWSPAAWSLQALLVPGFGGLSYVQARRATFTDGQPLPSRWYFLGAPTAWLALVIGGFFMGMVWSTPSSTALVAASTMPGPTVSPLVWGTQQRLTATLADTRFAVTGHARQPLIRYGTGETRAAGGFVIVHLAVRHLGRQPEVLMPSRFSLIDGAGRHYSASFAGETALLFQTGHSLMLEPLQPGLDRAGDLVFDVPATARRLTLAIMGPEALTGTAMLPVF